MHNQLVSVIVSCYNAADYIAKTIESLLAQTYSKLEFIFVNDGSTDNTEQIIESFTDGRIRYFYQPNKGQCAALNFGFSKSQGSFIKFYDADDILHPEAIEGQVNSLMSAGEYDISFIEWRRFYNNEVPLSIDHLHPHTIHRDCTPIEYTTHLGTPPMYQCGIWLIPRTLIDQAGLWTEHLSLINDTEYFSRLLSKAGNLKFSDRGYTLYRTNANALSLSSDFSAKGIRSGIKSIDMTARSYLSMENSNHIKSLIVQSYSLILNWAYPKHKIYSKIIVRRIRSYSGQRIVPGKSGIAYNIIMKILGWKAAKQLAWWYYKLKYKS